MLVTEKSNSNFTRGDKASVSVRLRSNKTKTENPGVKKRNRHSGDFSFFKHSNKERFVQGVFFPKILKVGKSKKLFLFFPFQKKWTKLLSLNFSIRLKSLGTVIWFIFLKIHEENEIILWDFPTFIVLVIFPNFVAKSVSAKFLHLMKKLFR